MDDLANQIPKEHAGLVSEAKLTRKDFVTDQDVRWCPGCGDYAILAGVQRIMPELGVSRENIVWVSGIGCSSRFPYYMNTYGFHGIHGRAPAIAMGIKAANPSLSVWVATGDGDGLSIGGNHLLHCVRRNLDINILLFNNRIYGLTKGQYSPTSELGTLTKSTPFGSADQPIQPATFALGANASFVARTVDVEAGHLGAVLKRAASHVGTSLVEIYQNCSVFNDGAFATFTDRRIKHERQLLLEHGRPMRFGRDGRLGLAMRPGTGGLAVVEIGQGGVSERDVLVHDETNANLAFMLARMPFPEFPVALGVLYAERRPSYEERLAEQKQRALEQEGIGDLRDLLFAGSTWTVR